MKEDECCPACGAKLVLDKKGFLKCELCGFSDQKKSDEKEPKYIG